MFNCSSMLNFDCWPDIESLLYNNLCDDIPDLKSYFNETWGNMRNNMVEII